MTTYSKIKGDTALYLPVGTIMPWSKANVPAGFLYCNGQSVSRTTYADLFAVISTTFGSVDSNHFNVPDFQDRIPMGMSNNKAIASTGGANTQSMNATTSVNSASFNQSNLSANASVEPTPLPAHDHHVVADVFGSSNYPKITANRGIPWNLTSVGDSNYRYQFLPPTTGANQANVNLGISSSEGTNSSNHNHNVNFPSATRNVSVSASTNVSTVDLLNPYQAIRFMIRF